MPFLLRISAVCILLELTTLQHHWQTVLLYWPRPYCVGMYPGCVRLSFFSPETKWREQIRSPVASCQADPSMFIHPSNGSCPSLPTTTVFRKPIESVGRIFRVAISAANNTTRRRHYVKRLAELTATLGGSGQIFSLEVLSLATR